MVTHAELTAGHQIAQTAHALAEFALQRPEDFSSWRNGYIVCLQEESAFSLSDLLHSATERSLDTVAFPEADLNHEITAIAFTPSPLVKPFLSRLPLAGRNPKKQQRNGEKS